MFSLLPGYYFQPKNHLNNLGVESYEDYLLELVNESSFFLKKLTGKDKKYSAPLSEENGQCDCTSDSYELDFKLLGTDSVFEASNLITDEKVFPYGTSDCVISCPSKAYSDEKDLSIHQNIWVNALLRDFDTYQNASKEMRNLQRLFRTEKNVLLFYSFNLFFGLYALDIEKAVSLIIDILNSDLKKAFAYRKKTLPQHDTYFVFIYSWWNDEIKYYEDYFVICQVIDDQMRFIEIKPTGVSPTFAKINETCELGHGLISVTVPIVYDFSTPHLIKYKYVQGEIECLR